jgi:DNA-binding MarR family transcriptional regulator
LVDFLRFPRRFTLVCRLWGLQPTSKKIAEALGVEQSTLTRWSNFGTSTTEGSEQDLIDRFVKYLDEGRELVRRGYNAPDFAQCWKAYDDKQFLQFLTARSVPASVLELSQPKFTLLRRTLLEWDNKARYFMYRLGIFDHEDLRTFADKRKGESFLKSHTCVLRRVPASIQQIADESFLLYREAYREKEESIGSVFHVDSHFTIWGQDFNDNTSELFLITIKPEKIPYGPLVGLFRCAVLMLGDGNHITACKALMRRALDFPAQGDDTAEDGDFKSFATDAQRTIILLPDSKDATYKIDDSFSQEMKEPGTNISYKEYADYLSIKNNERDGIVLS